MQQAIKHGTDRGDIAEQFAPVLDGAIGSEQRAEAFVAAHDDFQQILGGGVREFAHAEVVDDEQRRRCHRFHIERDAVTIYGHVTRDGHRGSFLEGREACRCSAGEAIAIS
jgi:hypothetical protein